MRLQLTNDAIIKLPLDTILMDLDYTNDKAKSSKNYIKLKNNAGDTIIISRNKAGQYLYWNPNDEKDKGNIFNFCRNRNIKVSDLLEKKELTEIQKTHTIIPNNFKKETLESVEKFNTFKTLQTENFFLKNRMIPQEILEHFKEQIRMDNRENLCIPTYNLDTLPNQKTYFPQTGYQCYLKNPIYRKDSKPLKQICYGNKGLEILGFFPNKNQKNFKQAIQQIILTESSIDSLSLFTLLSNTSQNTLLCATNGILTQSQKRILENFNQDFPNAKILLGFDNDKVGQENTQKALQYLQDLEIQILKPLTKDFNDDLRTHYIFELESLNPQNLQKALLPIQKELEVFNKGEPFIYQHLKEQEYNKAILNAMKIEWSLTKCKHFLSLELIPKLQQSFEEFAVKLENYQQTKGIKRI